MRPVFLAVCLFASACLTSSKFDEDYLEAWCAAAEECGAGVTCGNAEPADPNIDCEFDSQRARDCLDGTWTCNDVEGEESAVPPVECIGVYTCVAAQ